MHIALCLKAVSNASTKRSHGLPRARFVHDTKARKRGQRLSSSGSRVQKLLRIKSTSAKWPRGTVRGVVSDRKATEGNKILEWREAWRTKDGVVWGGV